ncbi:hypothetical protein MTR67_019611 [Solanum verrucosum]|uniref:Mannitol dehydrogenase n=1 Tax=Solanum verrucosum TaxID=315347 RepID=A0AAF0TND6_SOLVR|nr:hypothetical protein MTR67_019611 [Solanum verrucosum]
MDQLLPLGITLCFLCELITPTNDNAVKSLYRLGIHLQKDMIRGTAPEKPVELLVFPLLMGRKLVAGSCIGGMKETQEMLDFAAKHNITLDIEVVPMDYVNTALERLLISDVKYRFVLDIDNTLNKK